jgi:hypothetical protein
MVKAPKKVEGDRPQKEAEERRDAIIKKMLSTPPKPFTKPTKGKVSSRRKRSNAKPERSAR